MCVCVCMCVCAREVSAFVHFDISLPSVVVSLASAPAFRNQLSM